MIRHILISLLLVCSLAANASELAYKHTKVHQVVTADGIGLNVLELLDENDQPFGDGEPILLVHGFSSNWNSWKNVAEIYRKKGKRVFLANWRGHGQPPYQSLEIENPKSDEKMLFENLAVYDVPALVEFVSKETGGQSIVYQGHSMGGMMAHLAFAGLSKDKDGKLVIHVKRAKRFEKLVKAFIPVASPLSLTTQNGLGAKFAEQLLNIFGINNDHSNNIALSIPFGSLSENLRLSAVYLYLKRVGTLHGLMNLENMTMNEFIRSYYEDGSNVPMRLVRQVGQMSKNGYASDDGAINYREISQWLESKILYHRTTIPTLLMSAEDDNLAPLSEQKELARTRKLKQMIFQDVGHIDIMASAQQAHRVAAQTLRFVSESCESFLK